MPTTSPSGPTDAQSVLDSLRTTQWDDIADPTRIPALIAELDRLMLKATEPADSSAPPSEQLFDILMTRFEVMTPYKTGLGSLGEYARTDPDTALALYKALGNSLDLCLSHAGLSKTNNHLSPQRMACLASYGHVFFTWCHDSSPDSSATMADLNRILKLWDKFGISRGT